MGATYNGEPVAIGGWVPTGAQLSATVSDRVFALRKGAWVELPKLNHPRAAGAAAVVGDKLVVMGGQANGQLVKPTEVFDGKSWKDAAPMPTPRDHLAAASDGKYVYAVGGSARLRGPTRGRQTQAASHAHRGLPVAGGARRADSSPAARRGGGPGHRVGVRRPHREGLDGQDGGIRPGDRHLEVGTGPAAP